MNTKTLNISLPQNLITKVDKLAKQKAANRSELIRDALRAYVSREERWQQIFAYGEQQAKKLGIKESDVVTIVENVRKGK